MIKFYYIEGDEEEFEFDVKDASEWVIVIPTTLDTFFKKITEKDKLIQINYGEASGIVKQDPFAVYNKGGDISELNDYMKKEILKAVYILRRKI